MHLHNYKIIAATFSITIKIIFAFAAPLVPLNKIEITIKYYNDEKNNLNHKYFMVWKNFNFLSFPSKPSFFNLFVAQQKCCFEQLICCQ